MRSGGLARRAHLPELLDDPAHPTPELLQSYGQIDQVNRWFGGVRAFRAHLHPYRRQGVPLRVLDVGTGTGAVPLRLQAWAAGGGARWSLVGVDRHPSLHTLGAPRRGTTLPLVRGDALALPFRPGTFDVVLCTLTLHHFGDDDAVRLLAEMGRVAARAVLVNDLERTALNYLAARALSMTLWRRNRLTRHDGPVSVRRSFTLDELSALGHAAGLRRVSVHRHFPWRLVLRAEPPGRPPS